MTFYQHIIALRGENKIPKIWSMPDIRPFLKNNFSPNAINVLPANSSMTPDGKVKGDFVKKGQEPKFYRMGRGQYIVVNEYDGHIENKIIAKDKTKVPNRSKVENNIVSLVNNFIPCLNYFNDNIKFSGPSTYFHKKTIDKIRTVQDYKALLADDYFIELVYATLVSWGMHTMGPRGALMGDFDVFRQSITVARDQLLELHQYNLHTLTEYELNYINPLLKTIFRKIKIMASRSSLVGNSKVMHHLLPDLVPPIDGTHTLKFFYGHKNISKDESYIFLDCMEKFHQIARSVPGLAAIPLTGFNTSIPKIIDNAIMGYIMRDNNKKKEAKDVI